MKPFVIHLGDCALEVRDKRAFPEGDSLAVDLLRLMTVDEDLSNVERFKDLPESARSGFDSGEISQTKWKRRSSSSFG
jgi:hypothetical protein